MNLLNFFATSNINSREVLKNLPDALFVVECDGKVSWVNNRAVRMLHCFEEDLVDSVFEETIVDGLTLANESFLHKKSIITCALTPDGREFFVELNAKKYADQYFVTLRDVTQMTNVFSDVEKTGRINKEKNFMLSKLENDFKSPLQSIAGFSQALKDGLCGEVNEKQLKYLDIINKNAKELSSFMDKFFELSYVESSLFRPEMKPFDCVNAIQETLKNFDLDVTAKKLKLEFDYEDLKKKLIYSDEKVLKSIVSDIVETAVSSTDLGVISVKLSNLAEEEIDDFEILRYDEISETSYLKLEIKDTGVGIAESEMKTIFEPYSLLDSSNKKAMSRAIVFAALQGMVKKLQGDIKVSSEVMKGSVCTVVLPIEKDKDFKNE